MPTPEVMFRRGKRRDGTVPAHQHVGSCVLALLLGACVGGGTGGGSEDAQGASGGDGGSVADSGNGRVDGGGSTDSGIQGDGGSWLGDGGPRDGGQDAGDAGSGADAALNAPDAAVEPGPHFFVHLSDVHIGSGAYAVPAFAFVLAEVLPAFPGIPTLVTGDLVEAGNNTGAWETYRNMVDGAGLSPETFVECPGNHDSFLDGDLSGYLQYSLAGRAGRGLGSIYEFSRFGERIRVITTNTAAAGDPVRDGAGFVAGSQVDALLAQAGADPVPPRATLVMGHHPLDTYGGLHALGTDTHMKRLLDGVQASAYVFGHTHFHLNYWRDRMLMTMAATSGNPNNDWFVATHAGFSLMAVDDGPSEVAMEFQGDPDHLSLPWPLVMITRPADPALGIATPGERNPWSATLPRGSTGHVLHAGAFAPEPVLNVTFRVDNGPEEPMEDRGGYYRAIFDVPVADQCTITVTAQTLTRSSSATTQVNLQ